MKNRKMSRSKKSSKYKCVFLQDGRWRARISCDGKSFSLGYFDTAEKASIAYDVAAYVLFDEYVRQ